VPVGEGLQGNGGVAGLVVEDIVEAAALQHVVDKGIAAGDHPGFAPDEIGCSGTGDGLGGGAGEGNEAFVDFGCQLCGPGAFPGKIADGPDHVQGSGKGIYIADPDRVAGGEGKDLVLPVLFLIGDDEVGVEGIDDCGMDILCATDPGLAAEPCVRMDTKFGDAYHFGFQAEGK